MEVSAEKLLNKMQSSKESVVDSENIKSMFEELRKELMEKREKTLQEV